MLFFKSGLGTQESMLETSRVVNSSPGGVPWCAMVFLNNIQGQICRLLG